MAQRVPGVANGKLRVTESLALLLVSGNHVGLPRDDVVKQVYAGVERTATITCHYCMPEKNDVPVCVATRPRAQIQELWPQAL